MTTKCWCANIEGHEGIWFREKRFSSAGETFESFAETVRASMIDSEVELIGFRNPMENVVDVVYYHEGDDDLWMERHVYRVPTVSDEEWKDIRFRSMQSKAPELTREEFDAFDALFEEDDQ